MGSTKYSLCWADHESNLIESLKSLLQTNSLVDCTIFAEGQSIQVHRIILSSLSPYFQEMLKVDCDKHPIIFLKDVKFQIITSILEFVYLGKVQITEDLLEEFFLTAHSLQIKGLTNNGSRRSKTTLSSSEREECVSLVKKSERSLEVVDDGTNGSCLLSEHQYCLDSEVSRLCAPQLLDGDEQADSDCASASCEDSTAAVSGSKDMITPISSGGVGAENLKPMAVRLKRSMMPSVVGRGAEEKSQSKMIAQRGALKSAVLAHRMEKTTVKPGMIIIKKREDIFPKQKVAISRSEGQPAFIVGSRVLTLPKHALRRKEWLCPPKPTPSETKLYPCPQCKKLFAKPSILSNHMRTHTGEQPFKCEECGRLFSQRSNYRRHQRTHWEVRMRPKKVDKVKKACVLVDVKTLDDPCSSS